MQSKILIISILCVLSAVVLSNPMDLSFKIMSTEQHEFINSVQSGWTAGINTRFHKKPIEQIMTQFGALETPEHLKLPLKEEDNLLQLQEIPQSFNAREAWPKCESLFEVRDQSNCGSCWAFGAVEAMSDRICIHSNQTLQTRLSADNLVSCCGFFTCGNGCNGGFPSGAWRYWVKTGIVTGDLHNVTDWCQPYSFPACDHHVVGTLDPCGTGPESKTPKCRHSCDAGYPLTYDQDLHFGASSYSLANDEAKIRAEIFTNGPVEASFTVYSDLLSYKTGVYTHVTGDKLGGHAIKVIGFGVDNDVPYWLIVNSWNEDWGDRGTFKIKRGTNECGIESGMVAGLPKY